MKSISTQKNILRFLSPVFFGKIKYSKEIGFYTDIKGNKLILGCYENSNQILKKAFHERWKEKDYNKLIGGNNNV